MIKKGEYREFDDAYELLEFLKEHALRRGENTDGSSRQEEVDSRVADSIIAGSAIATNQPVNTDTQESIREETRTGPEGNADKAAKVVGDPAPACAPSSHALHDTSDAVVVEPSQQVQLTALRRDFLKDVDFHACLTTRALQSGSGTDRERDLLAAFVYRMQTSLAKYNEGLTSLQTRSSSITLAQSANESPMYDLTHLTILQALEAEAGANPNVTTHKTTTETTTTTIRADSLSPVRSPIVELGTPLDSRPSSKHTNPDPDPAPASATQQPDGLPPTTPSIELTNQVPPSAFASASTSADPSILVIAPDALCVFCKESPKYPRLSSCGHVVCLHCYIEAQMRAYPEHPSCGDCGAMVRYPRAGVLGV